MDALTGPVYDSLSSLLTKAYSWRLRSGAPGAMESGIDYGQLLLSIYDASELCDYDGGSSAELLRADLDGCGKGARLAATWVELDDDRSKHYYEVAFLGPKGRIKLPPPALPENSRVSRIYMQCPTSEEICPPCQDTLSMFVVASSFTPTDSEVFLRLCGDLYDSADHEPTASLWPAPSRAAFAAFGALKPSVLAEWVSLHPYSMTHLGNYASILLGE